MNLRACFVTIRDLNNVEHTVEVSADSLYEAVALGYPQPRHCRFIAGIITFL